MRVHLLIAYLSEFESAGELPFHLPPNEFIYLSLLHYAPLIFLIEVWSSELVLVVIRRGTIVSYSWG
jgi:hypothetical protein